MVLYLSGIYVWYIHWNFDIGSGGEIKLVMSDVYSWRGPSYASSLPSILAWDDMPEPSALWRPVPAAVSDYPSSDQILVSEPLPRNAVHEAVQPLQGMPLHVALIEAERELVNVAVQVLVAGV